MSTPSRVSSRVALHPGTLKLFESVDGKQKDITGEVCGLCRYNGSKGDVFRKHHDHEGKWLLGKQHKAVSLLTSNRLASTCPLH